MFFSSWLRKPNAKPRTSRRASATFRPRLEALEGRVVPSTLTVTNNLDSGAGSLRADIAAANSGDTIQFAPSLSGQTIGLVHDLAINKNLTIKGPSAPNTPVTISGQNQTRIFEVDGATTNVTLSNLNLIDGDGFDPYPFSASAPNGQGGAIWNGGTLTITGCNLNHNTNNIDFGNVTAFGGAIYNAGTLSVQNCILNNNSAGPASSASNTGFGYLANGQGGAIYNAGMLTVSNSTLDYNFVTGFPAEGRAIFNAYNATATITNSTLFSYNDGSLGTIYNQGTMTLSGCTVSGGMYNLGTLVVIGVIGGKDHGK